MRWCSVSSQSPDSSDRAFKELLEQLKKSAEKLEEEFKALAKRLDEERKKLTSTQPQR